MQPQDAATVYIFKLWPWIEANKKRLAIGAGIIAAAISIFFFVSSQREQKEIDAGKALTQAVISNDSGQSADVYLKISSDYPSTLAGQRALLQAGAASFAAGQYADAQTQFQKFLDAYPDSAFLGQGALGVAASLDAQGKSDLAVGAYQRAISSLSDTMAVGTAKLAIARIYETQGKLNEALTLYEEIARANPNDTLGSEAAMRAMELKSKSPSVPSATAPAASFNLSP
jgi:tetratricopeptide (TPR) repeat protein